jgi:hypothetical protein
LGGKSEEENAVGPCVGPKILNLASPSQILISMICLLLILVFTSSILDLSAAGGEEQGSVSPSLFDRKHVPWLNNQTKFNWIGKENQLHKLLRMQQKSKWVSVLLFNKAVIRWSLNCIYSMIKMGGVKSYIAATTDEESLRLCMAFRLPCYNASYLLADYVSTSNTKLSTDTMLIGTRPYLQIVWAKVRLMQEILRLGFSVHFTDVDAVYLRSIYPSYRNIVNKHRVDAIFMKETKVESRSYIAKTIQQRSKEGLSAAEPLQFKEGWERTMNLFNTGIYAIRSTNHSLKLVEQWLASNSWQGHDQHVLNAMAFTNYVICSGPGLCQAARQAGFATIYRHPSQFGLSGVCPTVKFDPPCDPVRLFVHVICKEGWGEGEEEKGRVLSRFKLWLVDESGQPMYSEDNANQKHSFLPCTGLAWEDISNNVTLLDDT